MAIDGISAIAVILIASFGIDRIVNGALFLLGFVDLWNQRFPDPELAADTNERRSAERKQQLVYFTLAGLLGGVVLAYFGEVRIFQALGFSIDPLLDSLMTGLILMAGADQIGEVEKLVGGAGGTGDGSSDRPLEISGRLILEEPNHSVHPETPNDTAQKS